MLKKNPVLLYAIFGICLFIIWVFFNAISKPDPAPPPTTDSGIMIQPERKELD